MTNANNSFIIVSGMNELLSALKGKQESLHLSQNGMARHLSLSSAQISLIMTGEKPIGRDLLSAVTAKFPDLQPLVLKVLAEFHNDKNGKA